MRFLFFIFVFFIISNSTDKTLSVNLCKKLGPTFDKIFGEEWANEIIEENQNVTDQNGNFNQINRNELTGQTDQLDVQQKSEIIHKFHAIKELIKKTGKCSTKVWNKIEQKIVRKLGISRQKIYKWKKELKLNKKISYKMKKREFVERSDEFKRRSDKEKQKQFANELGIYETTLRKGKREFGIEIGKRGANKYYKKEKISKMNDYYKMKNGNPSLSDKEIAAILKIGNTTLKRWKKEKKIVKFHFFLLVLMIK